MVHKEPGEGKKRKPRGRPFTSEYNPARKPKNDFLATARRERRDGGEDIAPDERSLKEEPLKEEMEPIAMHKKTKRNVEVIEEPIIVKEEIPMGATEEGQEMQCSPNVADIVSIEVPAVEESKAIVQEEQLVDQIEFKNGTNTLKIVFKKKHNRMFRIQVFMNDSTEIRPVTYTGSLTAMAFWNLLKGSLKNER